MAESIACPKCHSPIDLSQREADGRVVCGDCGAKLKVRRTSSSQAKPQAAQPAPPSNAAPADEDPLDALESLEPSAFGGANDLLNEDNDVSSLLPDEAQADALDWSSGALSELSLGDYAGTAPQSTSSSNRPADAKRTGLLIGGICAGGMVLLLMLGGLVALLLRGGSSDGDSDGDSGLVGDSEDTREDTEDGKLWAAKWVGGEIPSRPVTFDTPVVGAGDVDVQDTDLPRLEKAEPFDEAAYQPQVNPAIEHMKKLGPSDSGEQVVEPETFDDEPRWHAEADAASAGADYEIAESIQVPQRGPENLLEVVRIADRGGPFLLLPPAWEKLPMGKEYAAPPADIAHTPIEVMDIRTGEVVGVFDWRIPFRMAGALAPNGMHFLGPYHVPSQQVSTRDVEVLERVNSLYVWQRDSDQPPKRLLINGYASWFRFVDAHTAAILIEQPARELQFWDVITGEQRSAVPLPPDERNRLGPSAVFGVFQQRYFQRNDVAISPGGRYAAVVTGDTVTMISIEDAKILGETEPFLPTGRDQQIQGLTFSPAGTEIIVVFPATRLPREYGVCLLKLSATDGRRLVGQTFKTFSDVDAKRGWGPLFPGPRDGSWIHAGRRSYRRHTSPIYYEFGRPHPVRLPAEEILLIPNRGAILIDAQTTSASTESSTFAMKRTGLERLIASTLGEPLGPALVVDRSGQRIVEPVPPRDWQPLTELGRPLTGDCPQLPTSPWYTCWGDAQVGAFIEYIAREAGSSTGIDNWWLIDRATGRPTQKPIELRRWIMNRFDQTPLRALAMSPDGTSLVLSDPQYLGRVDVWSIDGRWQYGFQPFEDADAVVEWTGFDAEGQLLVGGGGAIARFELGDQSVTALYKTENTHYLAPFELGPERKRLIASRGQSLDILDVTTGQILNRLGIIADPKRLASNRMITDFAVSPDGKHAAAVYALSIYASGILRRLRSSSRGHEVIVGIWNLETGEASRCPVVALKQVAELSWAGPDLLIIGDRPAKVLDLKCGLVTAEIKHSIGTQASKSDPIATTPDGRVWGFCTKDPRRAGLYPEWTEQGETLASSGHVHFWKSFAIAEEFTKGAAPIFADDRQFFRLDAHPIRLTIDIGDPILAKMRAKEVLKELQGQGLSIGPNGFELHVGAELSDSSTKITMDGVSRRQATAPRIDYTWSLRDKEGREVWSAKSSGNPDLLESRYLNRDYRGVGSPFDFGDMPMREAVAKEILEIGDGLELRGSIPTNFIRIGSDCLQLPVQL